MQLCHWHVRGGCPFWLVTWLLAQLSGQRGVTIEKVFVGLSFVKSREGKGIEDVHKSANTFW
jgi:hypothetical protein